MSFSGAVFLDANVNGLLDSGETGVANQIAYIDANNNGVLDTEEQTAITNSNGQYSFSNLTPGTYTLRLSFAPGTEAVTVPANGELTVSLNGVNATNMNFGEIPTSPPVPIFPIVTQKPTSTLFPQGFPNDNGSTAFVVSLYRKILDRLPTLTTNNAPEYQYWVTLLQAKGGINSPGARNSVALGIWQWPEHYAMEVTSYYYDLLGRVPDAAYIGVWVNALLYGNSGLGIRANNEVDVVAAFLNSAEYQSHSTSNSAFVQGLFTNLGLQGTTLTVNGQSINPLQGLQNNTLSRTQAIQDFLGSTEEMTRLVDSFYYGYLNRPTYPGPTEVGYWNNLFSASGLESVSTGILSSTEQLKDANAGQ